MNDLLSKLDETLAELAEAKVNEKVDALNFSDEAESAVRDAAEEYDFEGNISRACENYNFDDDIEKALENYDFSDDAEKAVTEFVESDSFSQLVEEKLGMEIEKRLEAKLPGAIEKHLLRLLEKPEIAEKLVRLLFDRASE